MKFTKIEQLNISLKDEAILLKNLEFNDYLALMELKTQLSKIVEAHQEVSKNLIEEYNKPFVEERKSEAFKKVLTKKKEDRTEEETVLLSAQPPVRQLDNGFITGPVDFIEKFNKLREKDHKVNTKILKDKESFKRTFENVTIEKQLILFETLLK